ncbi:MAG: hypothetical protein U9R25_19770, partial [Chloroflexota bacterium]|nr:hypothetical protein [Chloroflexota bacterium]
IEGLWKWLREEVTQQHCYKTMRDLFLACKAFIERINLDPVAIISDSGPNLNWTLISKNFWSHNDFSLAMIASCWDLPVGGLCRSIYDTIYDTMTATAADALPGD